MEKLLTFLKRLDSARIHYQLSRVRDDAIMVHIAVPGERWEVEFMSDDSVEIERFMSNGKVEEEAALSELFSRFGD